MTADRRRNFSVSICNLSYQVFVKIFSHEAKLFLLAFLLAQSQPLSVTLGRDVGSRETAILATTF